MPLANNIGSMVIIGGAEDKRHACTILREVVDLAGGRTARLLVLTVATQQPEKVGTEYRNIFSRLGASEVGVLDIARRGQAEDPMLAHMIDHASGIFFTGGDQLRITSILGGTRLYQHLLSAYRRGVMIAGTSAGASVMSSTMIVHGSGEQEPTQIGVRLAPGFGLVPDVVIDQHFAQRGRLGRLLSAVAQNPHVMGIGIDENTAVIVGTSEFVVKGSGTVTVLDGQHISFTNMSEVSPTEALALADIRLHVLPSGYGFSLEQRRPIAAQESEKRPREANNS